MPVGNALTSIIWSDWFVCVRGIKWQAHHLDAPFQNGSCRTRGLAPPPVQQPAVALFHVALPPAPHVPVADACHQLIFFAIACNIRSCTLIARSIAGPGISFHAPHGLLFSPPATRTYRVLSQPDISCADDTRGLMACTTLPQVLSSIPAQSQREKLFAKRRFGYGTLERG